MDRIAKKPPATKIEQLLKSPEGAKWQGVHDVCVVQPAQSFCSMLDVKGIDVLVSRIAPEHEIGCGSYGRVYKVSAQAPEPVWLPSGERGIPEPSLLRQSRDEYLALKEAVAANEGRQGSAVREFKNEVKALKCLNHPNIMPLLGVYQAGDRHIFIMPCYPDNLHNVIHSQWQGIGFSDIRVLFSSFVGLSEAVKCVHDSNWLHGDIKSANILVDEKYDVVLADFGSSGAPGQMPSRVHANEIYNGFFAPELILNRSEQTVSSDVFSCGLTCLEMLTLGNIARGWEVQNDQAVSVFKRLAEDGLSGYCLDFKNEPVKKALQMMYDIIGRCLSVVPSDRPEIADVAATARLALQQYDDDLKRQKNPIIEDDIVSTGKDGDGWSLNGLDSYEFALL